MDERELMRLYDRYGRVLYSLLLCITGDENVSQDLLHRVFVEAWNRSHQASQVDGLALVSSARMMALDHVRNTRSEGPSRGEANTVPLRTAV